MEPQELLELLFECRNDSGSTSYIEMDPDEFTEVQFDTLLNVQLAAKLINERFGLDG